jgi:hypothetical protein
MTGKKGRSGRITTPEQKRARSDAARKRWGLPPSVARPDADEPTDGPAPEPTGELRTIAEHDAHIGRPMTWPDALKRLQMVEQHIINDRREVELERTRAELDEAMGRLVPRADLDAAIASIRDAWWRSAQQITSDVLSALPGLPLEARELIRKATDDAVQRAAARVKSDLTS